MKKIIFVILLGMSIHAGAQKTILSIAGEKLAYPPATTNTLGISGNTLTSTVNGIPATADLSAIGKEPWNVEKTTTQATSNTQNIFQMGNVGLGNNSPQGKLDVTGNIYTTAHKGSQHDLLEQGIFSIGHIAGNATGEGAFSGMKNIIKTGLNGINNASSIGFYTWGNTVAASREVMKINELGNVGIGTSTPAVKLDINNGSTNGAVKIVDGTQGTGKVLTSDANGVGTWKDLPAGSGGTGDRWEAYMWGGNTTRRFSNLNNLIKSRVPNETYNLEQYEHDKIVGNGGHVDRGIGRIFVPKSGLYIMEIDAAIKATYDFDDREEHDAGIAVYNSSGNLVTYDIRYERGVEQTSVKVKMIAHIDAGTYVTGLTGHWADKAILSVILIAAD